MAFNLSGVDLDLYFDVNLAINLSIFGILVFPPFLLCLLCVLGLVLTKDIHVKIRVLLINIFVAEISNWVAHTVFYLGFPIRLAFSDDYTCKLFVSCLIVSAIQKSAANALYAINIYIFIKDGVKKLKWMVIVPYIVMTWAVAFLGGIIPYFEIFGAVNINGFCNTDIEFVLLWTILIPAILLTFVFLSVELICSILTAIYIKKNTLRGNKKVKKVASKYMLYLVVTSILSFLTTIVPTANPAIRRALPENDIIGIVAVNYLLRIILTIPTYATPIVAIVLLKPVRTALKKICCKNRVEPVATEPAAVEHATMELAAMKHEAVKPAAVERATMEPVTTNCATKPAALETVPATTVSSLGTRNRGASSFGTSSCATMETATVEPATTECATVKPATLEPETVEPETVEPAALEQASIELNRTSNLCNQQPSQQPP